MKDEDGADEKTEDNEEPAADKLTDDKEPDAVDQKPVNPYAQVLAEKTTEAAEVEDDSQNEGGEGSGDDAEQLDSDEEEWEQQVEE